MIPFALHIVLAGADPAPPRAAFRAAPLPELSGDRSQRPHETASAESLLEHSEGASLRTDSDAAVQQFLNRRQAAKDDERERAYWGSRRRNTVDDKKQKDQSKEISELKTMLGNGQEDANMSAAELQMENTTLLRVVNWLKENPTKIANEVNLSAQAWEATKYAFQPAIDELYAQQKVDFEKYRSETDVQDSKIASAFTTEKAQFAYMKDEIATRARRLELQLEQQARVTWRASHNLQTNLKSEEKAYQRGAKVLEKAMQRQVDLKDRDLETKNRLAQEKTVKNLEDYRQQVNPQDVVEMQKATADLNDHLKKRQKEEGQKVGKTADDIAERFRVMNEMGDKMLSGQQRDVDSELARMLRDQRKEAKARVKKMFDMKKKSEARRKKDAKNSRKDTKNAQKSAIQSFDDFASSLGDAVITAGDTAEEVDEGVTTSKEHLQDMDDKVKQTGATITKDGNDLKRRRMEEIVRLTASFEKAFGAAKQEQKKEKKAQLSERDKLEGDLKENLAVLANTADMGLGGLKKKLGTFGEELDQTFDNSADWQKGFDGHLAELGGDFEGYQSESEAELDGLHGAAQQGEDLAEESVADFGNGLLNGLQTMEDGLGNNLAKVKTDSAHGVEDAEKFFNSAMSSAKAELHNEMGALSDDMRGFSRRLTYDHDTMERANAENSEQLSSLMTNVVPQLQEQALGTAEALQQGAQGVGAAGVKQQMEFAQQLRKSMDASKNALGGELASETQRQEGEVKDWIAFTNGEVRAKAGEKTALEKAMREGTKAFASEEERLAANLKDVQSSANKLNQQVRQQFLSLNQSLAGAELMQAKDQEELEATLRKRTAALEKLGQETVAKMSDDQRIKFQRLQAERQAKIDRIMRDGSKSFDEKLRAIQAVDDDMKGVLSDLQAEAMMTDKEVRRVHEEMAAAEKEVGSAVANAQSLISASDLLLHDDEEKQKAALEERMRLMKQAVLQGREKTHEGMEEEIDAVTQEAQARIAMILKHKNMTEAEKREAIAQVDESTRIALQDLGKRQVALDHELQSYTAEQRQMSSDVSEQLGALEGVLKDEQMAWLKKMVAEKEDMRDKLETMETTVDEFIGKLEAEGRNVDGELSDQQKARLMRMKEVRLKMSRMSADRTVMADEAMQLAELAEKETESDGGGTEHEISVVNGAVQELARTERTGAKGLWNQLGNEMKKRSEAMDSERATMVQNNKELLKMIAGVTQSVGKAAAVAAAKQRNLTEKVGMMQTMMEAEVMEAGQTARKQEAYVKTLSADQQAQYDRRKQEREAARAAMAAQQDAADAAAAAAASAALNGPIGSALEMGQDQLRSAVQAESTKVGDVIHGELAKMNALTENSSKFSSDVAGYSDTVQKQRSELRRFSDEVQYHLAALQDEDALGQRFGDEVRAAGLAEPASLAEDPSAVLDDIESKLDDDDSALDQAVA